MKIVKEGPLLLCARSDFKLSGRVSQATILAHLCKSLIVPLREAVKYLYSVELQTSEFNVLGTTRAQASLVR